MPSISYMELPLKMLVTHGAMGPFWGSGLAGLAVGLGGCETLRIDLRKAATPVKMYEVEKTFSRWLTMRRSIDDGDTVALGCVCSDQEVRT